jgi:hypothetical protein
MGEEAYSYSEADADSLCFVLRSQLHERFQDVPEQYEPLHDAAVLAVIGVDVSRDYSDIVPDEVRISLRSVSNVEDALDAIDAAYEASVAKAQQRKSRGV